MSQLEKALRAKKSLEHEIEKVNLKLIFLITF